jgi:hypothetical protein
LTLTSFEKFSLLLPLLEMTVWLKAAETIIKMSEIDNTIFFITRSFCNRLKLK